MTGFPVFSLLPAGMGEPAAGRFEEEAREARAEMRRRVALDEIDRAKDRQARTSDRIAGGRAGGVKANERMNELTPDTRVFGHVP